MIDRVEKPSNVQQPEDNSAANRPTEVLAALRAPALSRLEVVGDEEELNLAALRIDPSFMDGASATVQTIIPIGYPKNTFFRVHAATEFRPRVLGLRLKTETDDAIYLVHPKMMATIGDEVAPYVLYAALTRGGTLRVIPVRQAGSDGKQNEWHRSADLVCHAAMETWVMAKPDKGASGYRIVPSQVPIPDPQWPPDMNMDQIIKKAFTDRGLVISKPDHPVAKLLRGEL